MDREKVIKELEERIKVAEEYMGNPMFTPDAIRTIVTLLKEQEVVKPKTGHWFKIHGGTAAQCTICKCWGQINMKFCPWCGAKIET